MSDKKSAIAINATGLLNDIILERYLINIIPKNRQLNIQEVKKQTGYNFLSIRNYVYSELFSINKTTIEITDNNKLLSERSKTYCERLIKKLVFPSKYEYDKYIYYIGKLLDSSYYTSEEKKFIDIMLDNLFCLINDKTTLRLISRKDLLKFNLVNSDGFNYVTRNIYNSIIHNELHAGDNIMSFITHSIKDKRIITEKLVSSTIYDYFFNEDAVLRCDFDTNTNLLIKNFLNLSIYNFNDIVTRIILLLKLNSKYSFLIRDKVFNEFE